ncbi:MAG: hypothetical protein FJ096_03475 [Deltaproteobacteria bacterium]|nr:hypothetical protein [Deltaproteobacteria bacterium]
MRANVMAVGAGVAVAALGLASEARAEVVLGASLGAAVPISAKGFDPGLTGDLRIGYQLPLKVIGVTVEAQGGYTAFSPGSLPEQVSAGKVVRVTAGGRVSVGKLFEPYLAAHIGYGWVRQSVTASDVLDLPGDLNGRGVTADGRLGLQLNLMPVIRVGADVGYSVLFGTKGAELGAETVGAKDALNWLTVGLNGALVF